MSKFIKKSQAEIDAMTTEDAQKYFEQKEAHDQAEVSKQIQSALLVQKAETEQVTKDLQDQIAKLKEQTETLKVDEIESLQKQIETNKEVLAEIAKGISSKEIIVKTAVLRSAITNNQQAYDLPDIGQLATRRLSMYDIFPKLTIADGNTNGVIRYYDWDENTIARAAAAVAEGGTFPESTAVFKKGSIPIQKIGDTLPVSEEFFEDAQMFAAELGLFLDTNVNLIVDYQIANGDGTGNTLTGLFASINAYTPVASGISAASIYDLFLQVQASITATGGAKYTPDFAVMNITDINKMLETKDTLGQYVRPPFVTVNGNVINVNGITVIESNAVPANTMVIGDRRFAKIYEKGGVELSKGYVNGQFTADEMTLKARKRLAFLIRSADKGGFKKVTSISAALTTIAS